MKNRERLRAFVKQYGIEYTVLIAGEPGDLHDKLPQGVNLNCWPTTFLLGRDGRVRGIHAGFPGYASSALRTEAERDSPPLSIDCWPKISTLHNGAKDNMTHSVRYTLALALAWPHAAVRPPPRIAWGADSVGVTGRAAEARPER